MFLLSGSFKKRKRKSIIVTGMLLVVSVLILVFGLAATTRTQNITVGGYYPGVIVSARLAPQSVSSVTTRFTVTHCHSWESKVLSQASVFSGELFFSVST